MHASVFLIALAAVGVMGFANQRGSTCTVAALEEVVLKGTFKRLIDTRGIALGWRGSCSTIFRRSARFGSRELYRRRWDGTGRFPVRHWGVREQSLYFRHRRAARLRKSILPRHAPWILSRQPRNRPPSWSNAIRRPIAAGRRVCVARRSRHPAGPRTSLYARPIHAADRQ